MTTQAPMTESYRPQFHFSPELQWMNDPNGLVYYNGEYHLFYQYHPHSTIWGPMHWGHAVSTDLVHWTHLPIALYPDKNGSIFSGSAVVDVENTSGLVPGGGLVAMYSYENQSQGIAASQNNGRSWTMYAGNPVIPTPGTDFRDPKVFWYTPMQQWVMILAAQDRVKIYASKNLIEWTFASEFGANDGSHGGVWECPDLFPLVVNGETKWVMIVSIGTGGVAGGSATQYFIGTFDGTTFTNDHTPETIFWLDYGTDNYAGVTWSDVPDDRRIFIGWMNNWEYGRQIPTSIWRGAMTVPRTLELRDIPGLGIRLIQRPITELEILRESVQSWRDVLISPETANLLTGVESKTVEIMAEFEVGNAAGFGFRVHKDGSQYTTIGYDARTAQLFVDRRSSGTTDFHASFAGIYYAPLAPVEGRIKLHIFVDWSSIEVFANDGQIAMTYQVFPDEGGGSLEIYAAGSEVMLKSLDVYRLKSVW